MIRDSDSVELADDAYDWTPSLLQVRLRARDTYLGLIGPAHLLVLLLGELGGLELLEAQLRLLPDRIAYAQLFVGARINSLNYLTLDRVLRHG